MRDKYAAIVAHRDLYSVTFMCTALEISENGFSRPNAGLLVACQ